MMNNIKIFNLLLLCLFSHLSGSEEVEGKISIEQEATDLFFKTRDTLKEGIVVCDEALKTIEEVSGQERPRSPSVELFYTTVTSCKESLKSTDDILLAWGADYYTGSVSPEYYLNSIQYIIKEEASQSLTGSSRCLEGINAYKKRRVEKIK